MTRDAFRKRLALQFGLDDLPSIDDQLFLEVGLDSFDAVMLVVWLETISEPDVLPATVPEIYTVRDAYEYYCSLREARA